MTAEIIKPLTECNCKDLYYLWTAYQKWFIWKLALKQEIISDDRHQRSRISEGCKNH